MNKINQNKYVFIIDNSIISANRIFNALSEVVNIFKVDYAANGKEALQKLADTRPNVILLDIQLPDMNGIDILQQIKQNYPNTAVIVLTDYSANHSFKIYKNMGADGYYNKTNELDMAIELLKELTK
jgi:DNA-binding NarL/FixJ family response regulator